MQKNRTIEILVNDIVEKVERNYKTFINLPQEERKGCFSWNKSKEKIFFELFFLYYFFFHNRLSLGNEKYKLEIRDLLFEQILEEIRKKSSIMNDFVTQKVGEIKTEPLLNYFEQADYPKVNDIVTQDEERRNFVNWAEQEGFSGIPVYMELYDIAEIVYTNRIKDLHADVVKFMEGIVRSAIKKSVIVEDNHLFHSEIMEKLKSELTKEDTDDLGLYLKLARYSLENNNEAGLWDYLVQVTDVDAQCGIFYEYLRDTHLI